MLLKRLIILPLFFYLFFFQNVSLFAGNVSGEYLCEIGIDYYKKGRLEDALHELRKSLVVDPGNETAKKYIDLIERQISYPESLSLKSKPQPVAVKKTSKPAIKKKTAAQKLDKIQIKKAEEKPFISKVKPLPVVTSVSAAAVTTKPKVSDKTFQETAKPEAGTVLAVGKMPDRFLSDQEMDAYLDMLERTYFPPSGDLSVPAMEKTAQFTGGGFEDSGVSLSAETGEAPFKKAALPKVLILDENIKNLKFPLEIESGASMIIKGRNIARFLATQPDVLDVERINTDELKVSGKNLGYTYLHVWDERDRWTLEFLTVPPKPKGPTLDEEMRLSEELSRNFKLRYSVTWSSFETGKRIRSLKRSSYSWGHTLDLTGEIPYGMFSSGLAVSALQRTTDLTYFSMALREGKFGHFKDFNLYAFDFSPDFFNLAFSGGNLRGIMLNSPAFNKRFAYTTFWGREGGGKYAGLSPGISKVRNSFLEGANFIYYPKEKQKYNFSVVHGWGRDRTQGLNAYGYDLGFKNRFDKWGLAYDVANDTDKFANLLTVDYVVPKLNLSAEFRDTEKGFKTLSGPGAKEGELGVLTNLAFKPSERLNLNSRLDVYRDRLYPREGDPHLLNENFDTSVALQLTQSTSFSSDFSFQNQLGRVSPFRSYNAGVGLARTFNWVRRINTFVNYRYTLNRNYSSPALDYKSDKIMAGLRSNLIGRVDYFLDSEYKFVDALHSDEYARPHAYQTGVDWNNRIFNSPFYGTFRFMYRDEENTLSPVSFFSGEDYIEGYTEISYKPNPEFETFANTRVRNVWAENPSVTKHLDVNFYAGIRYLWNTGLRWESTGEVEAEVFKDLNSDGLRQRDEPPVEGIKIWAGKGKAAVSDKFGRAIFKKVKAKKVNISIDTTTVPPGFTLTVPAKQEATIVHGKIVKVSYGISSRTEISGMVFVDADGNGEFSLNDQGLGGVIIRLEDATEVRTDNYGRYSFAKIAPGPHKLILDLTSIPPVYIPAVPVFRDIDLKEGEISTYNIPLKKL